MQRPVIALCSCISFGVAASSAAAATLLVPQQYGTLAQAVQASQSGDTVLIAPGIYPITGAIQVQKDILIQGAGAQFTTLLLTTLDSAIALNSTQSGGTLTIEGLTVRGDGASKGAFTMQNATVLNCEFRELRESTFQAWGEVQATVRGCTFTGKWFLWPVSVVASHGSTVTIEDSQFISIDNHGLTTDASPVQVNRTSPNATAIIRSCTFHCNDGAPTGGALRGNPSLIENCVFAQNSALYDGGAIAICCGVASSPTLIQNCHFFSNHAAVGGAIVVYPGAIAVVSQCEFGNNGGDIAGGIFSFGPLLVDDTAFCGQVGGDIIAGGLYGGGNSYSFDCGPDCDSDGIPDSSAIALGLVADLNGDGTPDRCVPTFHSADLNGDCRVDGSDLAFVLGGWASNSPAADVNGDGIVNGADLSLVLGQWSGL